MKKEKEVDRLHTAFLVAVEQFKEGGLIHDDEKYIYNKLRRVARNIVYGPPKPGMKHGTLTEGKTRGGMSPKRNESTRRPITGPPAPTTGKKR